MSKPRKPTPKEWAWIKEYALDFNGTDAYIRATGETVRNNAAQASHRYMKNPIVQDALQNYIQEQLGPQEKTLLGNVKLWTEIRDGVSPTELVPLEVLKEYLEQLLDDNVLNEIKALRESGKIIQLPAHKTGDRMKASEYLGKYAQMFVERKDVKVEASVQILDDL